MSIPGHFGAAFSPTAASGSRRETDCPRTSLFRNRTIKFPTLIIHSRYTCIQSKRVANTSSFSA